MSRSQKTQADLDEAVVTALSCRLHDMSAGSHNRHTDLTSDLSHDRPRTPIQADPARLT